MTINICVNGTFRYPQYIRHYEAAGVLGAFYYAHRPGTTGRVMGLGATPCFNAWGKEVLLQAAWRSAPTVVLPRLSTAICDLFQNHVIRNWRDCDHVEAVIGAVADRIIAVARQRGAKVLGHAVMAHPRAVETLVGRALADLGLDPRGARFPELGRRLAEIGGCDRILVDSTAARRSFAEHGVPAHRVTVVTSAVDLDRFAPRAVHERDRATFRVVCVGAITPRKGQHYLLRAWKALQLRDAELVLVGLPGRAAAAVVHGFDGRFVHRRRIPNAELRALLVSASVFVAPSVEDGFGQAPLEAMACGVPVIATANVGMADLIAPGVNGAVVPPYDAEAIAVEIERLYQDRERAEVWGEAAAAAARRTGSWSRYVSQVLAEHAQMRQPSPDAAGEAA